MTTKKVMTFLLLGGFCLPGIAQTPLATAFADAKCNDPTTSEAARSRLPHIAEQEMPTIEKDTHLICAALHDSNAYIRLQGAALLTTIVLTSPQHNQVVVSCFPDLIAAGSDPADKTRNDVLFTLAMNPIGPPREAHDLLIRSIGSDNFRTAELAAVGLIKEDGGKNEANHALVEQALNVAPDSKHRVNLLYAISDGGVKSESLFISSKRFVSDSDSNVQQAAIDAVAATGSKDRVVAIMGDLATSASADVQTKRHAQEVLIRLQASH
jgi:hypothetical protein